MINFDKLREMNVDQFAHWLDNNSNWDTAPWNQWLEANYCDKCEPVIKDGQYFAPCELSKSVDCEFADCYTEKIVKAWLLAEEN